MRKDNILDELLHRIPEPIYHNDDAKFLSEADYYGASRLIAEQLRIKNVPFSWAGWRHGWIHIPLKYKQQLTVWGKDDEHFLVAKEEHVNFLAHHKIKATAVGMPFIYAEAIDAKLRVPNTLLVMPQHTTPHVPNVGNEEQYIKDIEEIRHDFDEVVFCIHHSCYEHGIWPELLKKYNFPMIIGASANQTNAIIRLQHIFSSFEFVTTNTIGSHLPYAAYCGAKVSIYGKFSDFSNYKFDNDPYAKANQDLFAFMIQHTTEQYVRQLVPFLFCKHPKHAQQSISWAQEELGLRNKKPAEEIAQILGWNDDSYQHKMATAKLTRLKNQQKELTLASVCTMLDMAKEYSNNFAIYGAGTIGVMLLKVLMTSNLRPLYIFDKQYQQLSELDGVPVLNPDNISNRDLDLILVASFAHKEEIEKYISSIDSKILIWTAN